MRAKLIVAICAASVMSLGCSEVARADLTCAQRQLPDFSRDLNKNAAWNAYVGSMLTAPNHWPGGAQLRDGFKGQHCSTAWGNGKTYIGVTKRPCTFVPPTPVVAGTHIASGAHDTNPTNIQP